jgi:Na+-transporting methylmalonyl-CoA/oxaloacetate decarboxylase gamma subunit
VREGRGKKGCSGSAAALLLLLLLLLLCLLQLISSVVGRSIRRSVGRVESECARHRHHTDWKAGERLCCAVLLLAG